METVEILSSRIESVLDKKKGSVGISGFSFKNTEELRSMMEALGWNVDLDIILKTPIATSWLGTARRNNQTIKFVAQSDNESIDIINCALVETPVVKPEPVIFGMVPPRP